MEDMLNLENVEPFTDNMEYLDVLFTLETLRLTYKFEHDESDNSRKRRSSNKYLPDMEEIGRILDSKLESQFDEEALGEMVLWDQYVDKRVEASYKEGITLDFNRMLENLHMTKIGRTVIVLSMMAGLDRDYRRVIQYISGDMDKQYPSLEFCAKIYFNNTDESISGIATALNKDMEAIRIVFPDIFESDDIYNQPLIPSKKLLNLIYGIHNQEMPYEQKFSIDENLDPLIHRTEGFNALCQICGENEKEDLIKWVIIYGDKGSGKKHLVRHLAKKKSRNLIQIDINYFSSEEENREKLIRKAVNYSLSQMVIKSGLLMISGMETLTEKNIKTLFDLVKNCTQSYRGMIFFSFEKEEYSNWWNEALSIGLKLLNPVESHDIWKYFIKKYKTSEDVDLWALSNSFSFTPGQIAGALESACTLSLTTDGIINHQSLVKACYSQIQHRLKEKAKRVIAYFKWEDLKLPKEEKQVLKELCNRVKNKHIVMAKWNFTEKFPYGSGIPVVFAGPPGTGKTMAAQVIANELSMELYQIDLSQLIDKYIGETEKNIKMIFEQAKKSNSILFFDEADAIFGKRVEAKSSNDRYANVESSMLLQSVENYNGISILATNNYSDMDVAFIRRFKYLINFRAPDAELRKQIWESVFPKAAPVAADVDFKWLADEFRLTGASIKNIVLAAAFLAAENSIEIKMVHILKCLKTELNKEGRKLELTDLGNFGYLYSEL